MGLFGRKKKPEGPPPPPDSPDDPSRLPAAYRAPEDERVWAWLKRAPIDYFVEAWSEMDPGGYEDFRLWPRGDPVRGVRSIRAHVLDLVLEAAKAEFPNEFGGLLRAEKGIIEELVLLPGTVSGDSSAIFQMHMLPVDMSIIGTVHSHPSPVPFPSAADTALFERHGRLHIICGTPFRRGDWNAFDHRSRKVPLDVVE